MFDDTAESVNWKLSEQKLHKHEKENESSPSLMWIVTKFNLCNLYSNSSKG